MRILIALLMVHVAACTQYSADGVAMYGPSLDCTDSQGNFMHGDRYCEEVVRKNGGTKELALANMLDPDWPNPNIVFTSGKWSHLGEGKMVDCGEKGWADACYMSATNTVLLPAFCENDMGAYTTSTKGRRVAGESQYQRPYKARATVKLTCLDRYYHELAHAAGCKGEECAKMVADARQRHDG